MYKKISTLVIVLALSVAVIFGIPALKSLELFNGKEGNKTLDVTNITESEVLTLINLERSYAEVAPLTNASALRSSAEVKLKDMEAQQYFEHVSPQGTDVSILASRSGYEYIIVGENLAVGPFTSANDLVSAWMASPGHRANILSASYFDTGIAIESVSYQGQMQWMAVQHFGTKTSVCPKVDPELKKKINVDDALLKSLALALDLLEGEIESLSETDPERASMTLEFNIKVNEYNSLLRILESNTSAYNASVQEFNICSSKYTAGEKDF